MRDTRTLQYINTGPEALRGGQPISSSDYISLRERNKRRRAIRTAVLYTLYAVIVAYAVYWVRTH